MSASASASPSQVIEHFVLLQAKPDAEPSAVNAMLQNLNGLSSLDSVLHISAGPVARCRSASLTFTHMLHSHYLSKSDLASYTVDWVTDDFYGPVAPPLRLTVVKLKEEAGEKGKVENVVVKGENELEALGADFSL